MAGSEQGRMDLDQLRREIESGEIETVLTVFPDLYGRLMGKRIVGGFFLEEIAEGGMHVCDYLLASDMEMDTTPGYAFTSWEKGYGDMRAIPDFGTLRRAAWLDRTAVVLCDCLEEEEDRPIEVSPRRILQRQIELANAAGLHPFMGSELELFLFREGYRSARAKGYRDLALSQDYNEDYHVLSGTFAEDVIGAIRRGVDASAIRVEFSKGEASAGQHEINLRYASALEMADRHVLYKQAAKEIAAQQDCAVTFMAKWNPALCGNSLHIHLSLQDDDGKAVFAGVAGENEPLAGTHAIPSKRFLHAIGGVLAHAQELGLLFAPNVNSYKRYREGSFAPTRIAWSYDNRTVGLRVVGHGEGLRFECRIPGGDANPYLAYAGLLAAALDGIERELDPGPPFEGDGYQADELPRVPGSLTAAADAFDGSAFARNAFGDAVVDHLVHFARAEQQAYESAVTDWEMSRYFERI